MKRLIYISMAAGLVCCFAVIIIFSGCEDAGQGTVALTIEPAYIDISASNSNEWQTFTVVDGLRDLSLPLQWRVSNPSLGSIGASGGESASYVRSGANGDNSIIAEDQYGAEGVATVRQ